MNYWKKGCAFLLKNDPVFKHYYNPNHQLKTNKNKFEQIKEQAEVYKSEFGIETKVYSKEEFDEVGHSGTEQFGAFSYKPGFAINPLKFVNGLAKHALSKKVSPIDWNKMPLSRKTDIQKPLIV